MTKRFKVGDKVRLNREALESGNYNTYRERVLIVGSVSTRYMPAKDFFANGQPAGFHPGFDSSSGCALYDLEGCNFSLYDWELEHA